MKKTLAVLLIALSFCTVCGCSRKQAPSSASANPSASVAPTASAVASPETAKSENSSATESESTPVPPSSNKEVVTDDKAPSEIYWLMGDSNNLTYHLKSCPQLKDKEAQKVDWNLVKTIGLRQCPECNPPQYEGYVDAE